MEWYGTILYAYKKPVFTGVSYENEQKNVYVEIWQVGVISDAKEKYPFVIISGTYDKQNGKVVKECKTLNEAWIFIEEHIHPPIKLFYY